MAADNKGAVSLLLEKGFDECFHFKSLQEKILFRVDPKAKNNEEQTATEIAMDCNSMGVVEILWQAIGEEIPDVVKLQQMSKEMYNYDDGDDAKNNFKQLLRSVSPELVRIFNPT